MSKREIRESMNDQGPPPITEPLLTQTEAATVLRVEPRTLESWRQHRVGPRFIRYSRRCVRYRAEDLREWVCAQAVETRP